MHLLAVDWGTTSLRLAWLDAQGTPEAEVASADGILTVRPGEFATVLRAACGRLMATLGLNEAEYPPSLTLICGMAGSANGWQLAPYCPCPAGFDELTAKLCWVEPSRIAIVPGLSCEHTHAPDVMRGEETQVVGALQLTGQSEGWVLLPGSHSKWAWVAGGRVQTFHTAMTGEVYAALSRHTILAKTIDVDAPLDEAAFLRGVHMACEAPGGFLHRVFSARTLGLFGQQTPAQLASLLSGVCIGEEIRAQRAPGLKHATVVGASGLTQRYSLALKALGVQATPLGSECTWAGLHVIAAALPARPH